MNFAAHGLNTGFDAGLSEKVMFYFYKNIFPRNPVHEPWLVAGL